MFWNASEKIKIGSNNHHFFTDTEEDPTTLSDLKIHAEYLIYFESNTTSIGKIQVPKYT